MIERERESGRGGEERGEAKVVFDSAFRLWKFRFTFIHVDLLFDGPNFDVALFFPREKRRADAPLSLFLYILPLYPLKSFPFSKSGANLTKINGEVTFVIDL